ncbi:hypothetical protein AB4Z48_11745 [Cupriavidus sp. 2TAF22]|uniref:hypothetical protein n=1 Tax=unclassified Cupriavidus TaxID=2640874 RepID=UPI003F92A26E
MDNDVPLDPPRLSARSEPLPTRLPRTLASATLLAALVMMAALAGSGQFGRLSPAFLLHDVDHLSSAQQQARLEAFNAVTALPVAAVEPKDEETALAGMRLSAIAREALTADLHERPIEAAAASPKPATGTGSSVTPQAQGPETVPHPAPVSTVRPVAPARHPTRLIWLTLWDTDDEDGDVVRIQSQGYSRVVTLTRQPMTFAVPAASSGVVNIAGMRDGEGGGITVGVASGASRVTLPIMSVGQTIGLRTQAP